MCTRVCISGGMLLGRVFFSLVRGFELRNSLKHNDKFDVILIIHRENFQYANDLCYLCRNGTENYVSDSGYVISLGNHNIFIMSQWKVILSRKGPLELMCLPEEDEKISLFKQVARLNLFGALGIIRYVFDTGEIVPVPFIRVTLLIQI